MTLDKDSGHIQAVDLRRNPYLERIVSKKSMESVTRYCSPIFLKSRDPITNEKKLLVILDTPGRGDLKSSEVEISNAISILHAMRAAKGVPIYPVLLFSGKETGARLDIFIEDIKNYCKIIKNVEADIKGFSYYFTQYV